MTLSWVPLPQGLSQGSPHAEGRDCHGTCRYNSRGWARPQSLCTGARAQGCRLLWQLAPPGPEISERRTERRRVPKHKSSSFLIFSQKRVPRVSAMHDLLGTGQQRQPALKIRGLNKSENVWKVANAGSGLGDFLPLCMKMMNYPFLNVNLAFLGLILLFHDLLSFLVSV